jgi:hypothetical protein
LLEMTSENGDTCRLVVNDSTAKRFYTAKQHRMHVQIRYCIAAW